MASLTRTKKGENKTQPNQQQKKGGDKAKTTQPPKAQKVDRRKREPRDKSLNKFRVIGIDKLVVNICVGEHGDKLVRAAKVIEQLTNQDGVFGKARITIRQFNVRRNEDISVSCTVRGEKAKEILDNALKVKEYELDERNFSETGNFGFGIKEHIDLGIKYDPAIGIYGMDIYVVLSRPGFRVARRKKRPAKVGKTHKISKEDSMKWFVDNYEGIIVKPKAKQQVQPGQQQQ